MQQTKGAKEPKNEKDISKTKKNPGARGCKLGRRTRLRANYLNRRGSHGIKMESEIDRRGKVKKDRGGARVGVEEKGVQSEGYGRLRAADIR